MCNLAALVSPMAIFPAWLIETRLWQLIKPIVLNGKLLVIHALCKIAAKEE